MAEADVVKIAEDLYHAGKFEELLEHCQVALESDESNLKLWKLSGIAHGSLGNALGARFSFLCALKLDPRDASTLANYAVACFESDDKKSASQGIEKMLPGLDYEGQKVVLEVMMEAVTTGLITVDDLPPIIVDLMNAIDPTH
jgi:tetratricopeptide (TPR) repeat protein